ncbi:hypothetical protein TPS_08309 [Trichinella pseudospiralis]
MVAAGGILIDEQSFLCTDVELLTKIHSSTGPTLSGMLVGFHFGKFNSQSVNLLTQLTTAPLLPVLSLLLFSFLSIAKIYKLRQKSAGRWQGRGKFEFSSDHSFRQRKKRRRISSIPLVKLVKICTSDARWMRRRVRRLLVAAA